MSKKQWAWNLFKNIVKATVIMGVVGLAVGAAAPLLVDVVNIGIGLANAGLAAAGSATVVSTVGAATMSLTHILTTGATFGAFGAFSAVITPAVNYIFGERAHKTVTAKTLGVRSRSLGYEQAPDVSAAHAHAAGVDPSSMPSHDPSAAASVASATNFQNMVLASRAGMKPPGIA